VEVFEILGYFYEYSDGQFGGLSPSQILISNEGRIKMGLGVSYPLSINSNSIYNLKAPPKPR